MTQNEIFAQRLKNARVMKGYSMDELVAAMGNSLSKMAISKYEIVSNLVRNFVSEKSLKSIMLR